MPLPHPLRSSLLLACGLAALAACNPDPENTSTTSNTGTVVDMGGQGMPDLGDGLGATGAICGMSTQCASGLCVASQCAEMAGPMCGALHCRGSEVCDAGACVVADACPVAQICGSGCCEAGQSCEADTCVSLCDDGRRECEGESGEGVCCEESAACLFGGCVELGPACDELMPCACDELMPCARDEFCEPTLSRCVPRDADPNQCIYVPPTESFDPVEAWAWTGSMVTPESDQVMTSPIVGNLTDDNGDGLIDRQDIPDVVFTTFTGSGYNFEGVLRVISGDDGREIWSSTGLPNGYLVRGATTPALADIDGDGFMEIMISIDPQYDRATRTYATDGLMVVEHTGEFKWMRDDVLGHASGGPAVANVDGLGAPEILTGNALLSATGDLICRFPVREVLPSMADVDNDGVQEVIMGSAIWEVDDITKTDGTGCSEKTPGEAGYNAIANLDEDDDPEFVVVGLGDLSVYELDGSVKWRNRFPIDEPRIAEIYNGLVCDGGVAGQACATNDDCGGLPARCLAQREGRQCFPHVACYPGGGPPTVADFDGDGEAEIAVAGRWYYLVYEADGTIAWAHSTKDYSSGATGSSVFDFEGDGRAEVVYNDEDFLRVYRGSGSGVDADGDGFNDPAILLETPNTSGTLLEYPLIVDVDNDGNAEIVVSANDYAFPTNPDKTRGIRVFKDRQNNWVGTRRIWNQHTYHVTNIDEDGQVPAIEEVNWRVDYLNNYRQNVQGDGLFNAPDLVVEDLVGDGAGCAGAGAQIRFTLKNEGSLGVRAGALSASIYVGEVEPLTKVGVVTNTMPLAPGGSSPQTFTYTPDPAQLNKELLIRVVVDEDIDGAARYNECNEDNNTLDATFLCESAG